MLKIPRKFLHIRYNSDINPDTPPKDFSQLKDGSNCLIFVFSLLKHYGFNPPILWPIELYEDRKYTYIPQDLKEFDILFYGNDEHNLYWAHLALYIGDNKIIHLSKENSIPEICDVKDLVTRGNYKFLIGIKRLTP